MVSGGTKKDKLVLVANMSLITAVFRRSSTLLVSVVLTVASVGGQTLPTSLVDHRVVVQPFVNLSAQPEDAWVGAGIAEAVATALAGDGLAARVGGRGLTSAEI